jgi:uncharacterized membrane protein
LSLESGRKMGFTASFIAVVAPVITVITYVFLFFSLFGIFSSTVSGGSQTSDGSFFTTGFIVAIFVIAAVAIAGVILFLLAMHSLSRYYNEPGIFKNAFYGFLISIIGSAVVIAIFFVLFFAAIFSSVSHPVNSFSPLGFVAVILVVGVAAFAMSIVSAVLYKRAFVKLRDKSGVDNFGTAGTLYLVGTVLTIVFVGGLIVWIGWIFAALGFYSLKPKPVEPPTVSYPATQASQTTRLGERKFCIYCAAEISIDSIYCPNCGKVQH